MKCTFGDVCPALSGGLDRNWDSIKTDTTITLAGGNSVLRADQIVSVLHHGDLGFD